MSASDNLLAIVVILVAHIAIYLPIKVIFSIGILLVTSHKTDLVYYLTKDDEDSVFKLFKTAYRSLTNKFGSLMLVIRVFVYYYSFMLFSVEKEIANLLGTNNLLYSALLVMFVTKVILAILELLVTMLTSSKKE